MPWAMVRSPSIAMGICHAVSTAGGIDARSHSFHVAFQEFLFELPPKRGRLTIEEYESVCSVLQNVGAGEWPFHWDRDRERDDQFHALLRGHGKVARALLPKLRWLREAVPSFLNRCADEVLADSPDVVGFTTVYSQTMPNAALARVLKERDPKLRILFGGASCEGPMGRARLEALPFVDAIARGEAENILVQLIEALAHDGNLAEIPNLCYRGPAGELLESEAQGEPVDMDSVPVPDYYEYFDRLRACPRVGASVAVQLPIEYSRGCWWGAKKHCVFCGLNGLNMTSRCKSPDEAYEATLELCRRHKKHDLTATDNILPIEYYDTLLPRLAQADVDVALFYEVKANLTRERVKLLRDSGVRTIQPGIESLSSPILSLMRKGATAIQNVRLLKWSAEYGIGVIWNLLYGFPGETVEHYEDIAAMIPSLVHLTPPNLSEVMVYRFSPYFGDPAEFGLQVDRPLPYYNLLYDVGEETLWDLAEAFEHSHVDGRAPDEFLGNVREEVDRWRHDTARNFRALTYRRGPDFLTVTDTRTTTANGRGVLRFEMEEAHAQVYLACDAGATASTVAKQLSCSDGVQITLEEIQEILAEFVKERLMIRDGERYLSLALPNS